MSKILRVIGDAGHGPNTPGKRSPDGKLREFQFNKQVTERFKEILEAEYEGVEVRLVADHKGTTDVPLTTRTNIANSWPADVYVSIHANANTGQWGDWTGIETYVYTTWPKKSTELAKVVHAKLIKATGMKDRGVKAENFHVLRETKMPAILVECGFMDSRIDFPKLISNEYRETCARAIAEGVAEFYGLKKKAQPVQPKPGPFRDVPADHWAAEAIRIVRDAGLMTGREDGTFGPNEPVTRAQLAVILSRLIK